MRPDADLQSSARLYFLGDRALAEGFALIGFNVTPGATVTELDDLLGELTSARLSAFVVIDQQLACAGSRWLPRIYNEGGRVVVMEVPPLSEPNGFRLDIDERVQALIGGQDLEE